MFQEFEKKTGFLLQKKNRDYLSIAFRRKLQFSSKNWTGESSSQMVISSLIGKTFLPRKSSIFLNIIRNQSKSFQTSIRWKMQILKLISKNVILENIC